MIMIAPNIFYTNYVVFTSYYILIILSKYFILNYLQVAVSHAFVIRKKNVIYLIYYQLCFISNMCLRIDCNDFAGHHWVNNLLQLSLLYVIAYYPYYLKYEHTQFKIYHIIMFVGRHCSILILDTAKYYV